MYFGDVVKAWREKRGLSLRKVGELCGISAQSVLQVEKNRTAGGRTVDYLRAAMEQSGERFHRCCVVKLVVCHRCAAAWPCQAEGGYNVCQNCGEGAWATSEEPSVYVEGGVIKPQEHITCHFVECEDEDCGDEREEEEQPC